MQTFFGIVAVVFGLLIVALSLFGMFTGAPFGAAAAGKMLV